MKITCEKCGSMHEAAVLTCDCGNDLRLQGAALQTPRRKLDFRSIVPPTKRAVAAAKRILSDKIVAIPLAVYVIWILSWTAIALFLAGPAIGLIPFGTTLKIIFVPAFWLPIIFIVGFAVIAGLALSIVEQWASLTTLGIISLVILALFFIGIGYVYFMNDNSLLLALRPALPQLTGAGILGMLISIVSVRWLINRSKLKINAFGFAGSVLSIFVLIGVLLCWTYAVFLGYVRYAENTVTAATWKMQGWAEQALAACNGHGSSSPSSGKIAVVSSITGELHDFHFDLPEELTANSFDKIDTVVCISTGGAILSASCQYYENDKLAGTIDYYARTLNAEIVDRQTGQVVDRESFSGPIEVPESDLQCPSGLRSDRYGDLPSSYEISQWIMQH